MAKTIANKLLLKAGHRITIVNAPRDYARMVEGLPPSVREVRLDEAQFIHLFVRNRAELARDFPSVKRVLGPDRLLWISFPKKSARIPTDITRDEGWEMLHDIGYDGVMQVAIDDTWSALRFRPLAGEVKTGDVPDDVRQALLGNSVADERFSQLPFSHRREYLEWISSAKKPETRARRIIATIDRLIAAKKK